MAKSIVCFVFNSPVLVPWEVVKDLQGDTPKLTEAMISWQERKLEGYKFKENQPVADVNNPEQKMCVRRILRETIEVPNGQGGTEKKNRLKGIECYWWQELTVEDVWKMFNTISERRKVPGPQPDEQQ